VLLALPANPLSAQGALSPGFNHFYNNEYDQARGDAYNREAAEDEERQQEEDSDLMADRHSHS